VSLWVRIVVSFGGEVGNLSGAAHIPLERGGADAVGIQASTFASGAGDRAHIPQRRIGAPAR